MPNTKLLLLTRHKRVRNMKKSYPRTILTKYVSIFVMLLLATTAVAQDDKEEEKLPEPQDIELRTEDRVILHARFYPGTKGKNSVPIIMAHGWAGKGEELYDLAAKVQKFLGHAVIVPDLRAHGKSEYAEDPKDPNGTVKLDRSKMNKQDILNIGLDIRACKAYLMTRNNAEELNIEQLCIVAADVSCIPALEWSVYDWTRPRLPTIKLGRDIKAMVLLTPVSEFKGLRVDQALKHAFVRGGMSMMFLAGSELPSAHSDAKRLHARFERFHPPLPEDPVERRKKQDIFFVSIPTKLQGTKLLTYQPGKNDPNPVALIGQFITVRLSNRSATFPWQDRSRDD